MQKCLVLRYTGNRRSGIRNFRKFAFYYCSTWLQGNTRGNIRFIWIKMKFGSSRHTPCEACPSQNSACGFPAPGSLQNGLFDNYLAYTFTQIFGVANGYTFSMSLNPSQLQLFFWLLRFSHLNRLFIIRYRELLKLWMGVPEILSFPLITFPSQISRQCKWLM